MSPRDVGEVPVFADRVAGGWDFRDNVGNESQNKVVFVGG